MKLSRIENLGSSLCLEIEGKQVNFTTLKRKNDEGIFEFSFDEGMTWKRLKGRFEQDLFQDQSSTKKKTKIKSQMPGKVLKLNVKNGDRVEKNTTLLTLEAMKMENPIKAPHSGIVSGIKMSEGINVDSGIVLLEIESTD